MHVSYSTTFLLYLHSDSLPVLLSPTIYPHDVPFWQHYAEAENERFSVVVTTYLLVHNILDPS